MITPAMKNNINGASHSSSYEGRSHFDLGLTGHLKNNFPVMWRLYEMLTARTNSPPTSDEIAIASGKKVLDEAARVNLVRELDNASNNLKQMFEQQQEKAAVRFEYESTLP